MLLVAAEKTELAANILAPRGREHIDAGRAYELLHKSSYWLREKGKLVKAAQLLAKAATIIEATDPAKAVSALNEAIELLEAEGRPIYTVEPLEQMLKVQLTASVSHAAVGRRAALATLERMSSVFDEISQPHNTRRTALASVILHIAEGNVEQADEVFMSITDMRSDEAEAACELIDAVRESDPDAWARVKTHPGVVNIWPFVFQVLTKIKLSGVLIGTPAPGGEASAASSYSDSL